jgi:SAM-dependent methyltransferase
VGLACCDGERPAFPPSSFEIVAASDVIEHTPSPDAFVAACGDLLVPEGILFLATPNRFSLSLEPHVRLWGVGFLPRRLALRYVLALRKVSYKGVRPRASAQAPARRPPAAADDRPPGGARLRARSLPRARVAPRPGLQPGVYPPDHASDSPGGRAVLPRIWPQGLGLRIAQSLLQQADQVIELAIPDCTAADRDPSRSPRSATCSRRRTPCREWLPSLA